MERYQTGMETTSGFLVATSDTPIAHIQICIHLICHRNHKFLLYIDGKRLDGKICSPGVSLASSKTLKVRCVFFFFWNDVVGLSLLEVRGQMGTRF